MAPSLAELAGRRFSSVIHSCPQEHPSPADRPKFLQGIAALFQGALTNAESKLNRSLCPAGFIIEDLKRDPWGGSVCAHPLVMETRGISPKVFALGGENFSLVFPVKNVLFGNEAAIDWGDKEGPRIYHVLDYTARGDLIEGPAFLSLFYGHLPYPGESEPEGGIVRTCLFPRDQAHKLVGREANEATIADLLGGPEFLDKFVATERLGYILKGVRNASGITTPS